MELAENALKYLDIARKCKEWPAAVQLVYNTWNANLQIAPDLPV